MRDTLQRAHEVAGASVIGRPHFAAVLLEQGVITRLSDAYKRFLGHGKAGDVRHCWATMSEVCHWIVSAGGTAVLAHPGHYKLTNSKLRELVAEFRGLGGRAIEVVNGIQDKAFTAKLAGLCHEFALQASCGSDFHHPGSSWSEIGRYSALPGNCEPVWESW